METKHLIHVHRPGKHYGEPGEEVGIIKRVLRAECIGNFNPIFCTYKGGNYLVQSKQGDLSDPFRRDETYLDYLYIESQR